MRIWARFSDAPNICWEQVTWVIEKELVVSSSTLSPVLYEPQNSLEQPEGYFKIQQLLWFFMADTRAENSWSIIVLYPVLLLPRPFSNLTSSSSPPPPCMAITSGRDPQASWHLYATRVAKGCWIKVRNLILKLRVNIRYKNKYTIKVYIHSIPYP